MKKDLYQTVTDTIIKDLKFGIRPWMQPWETGGEGGQLNRPLRANGAAYQGINVLMLWASASENGFLSPTWMSFKQAQELGAHVRKGEKGTMVVYAGTLTRTEINEQTGEEAERGIPFLKSYTVFNADQIEGLPARFLQPPVVMLDHSQRIEQVDRFVAATGAEVRNGGTMAFYQPDRDMVQMPDFQAFREPEGYYATLLHELTHWTRHKSRLDRSFGRERWGDEGYAAEELVAELGAAFLCADMQITPTVRKDHAAYIGNWLKVLKNDKRAIFTAASYAQKAADYLTGLQKAKEAAA
ncbi:zincin-like metallopeptidase domain-containing protein [Devosia sp. 1566]|uniref:ArdC family protein n=1 Tax=Devosia sp. 1566 TaxID=2499144 RepID=UPI000FD81821|nr:zincin-like metallopeptidase domain-containing protein [Devosia sp. 1566]